MSMLTIANVFESRVIDFCYDAGNSERQLAQMLGGDVTGNADASPVSEAPEDLSQHFGIAHFIDGSFCLFIPNRRVIVCGMRGADGWAEV